MKRINYLDSLKGLAILWVIMVHCGLSKLNGFIGLFSSSGRYGVQLFLIIAAYLSFVSYKKIFDDKSISFRKKYFEWIKSKYVRLAPLFYIAIVFALICYPSGWTYWHGSKGVSIFNLFSHLIFVHGFFPIFNNSIIGIEWYLGVIFIWYLIVPFIYKIINNLSKSFFALLITLIISNVITNITNNNYIYNYYFNYYSILAQIPVLLLGVVYYFVFDKFKKIMNNILLSYSLIILFGILVYGEIIGHNNLYYFSISVRYGFYFLLLLVACSIYNNKIIDNKIFSLIGKNSYGMYLFHFQLIYLYDKYTNISNLYIKFIVIILLSLFISILLNVIISAINRLIKIRV